MLFSKSNRKNQSETTIPDALKLLCEPGEVYELRCPKTSDSGTVSGYFDDLTKLAYHADFWSGIAPAVYLTLNPVKSDLLARAANRIERRAKTTTSDHEIVKRRRLLLDFDPVRPTGVSSTDDEHEAALVRARECRNWLAEFAFPTPLLADSGNGGHLIYGLDFPNDDCSRLLVENFLKAIAGRFSDDKVKVDLSVFNAARISKVYGTMACKGDNIAERPHRRSCILEAPSNLLPVPQELLYRMINKLKPTIPCFPGMDTSLRSESQRLDPPGSHHGDPTLWVDGFLKKHGILVQQTKEENSKWRKRLVLVCLPIEKCSAVPIEKCSAQITVYRGVVTLTTPFLSL
jgi:hypothetical protein